MDLWDLQDKRANELKIAERQAEINAGPMMLIAESQCQANRATSITEAIKSLNADGMRLFLAKTATTSEWERFRRSEYTMSVDNKSGFRTFLDTEEEARFRYADAFLAAAKKDQ